MPAHDRRIVHMALANVDGVSTKSEGEGDLRHIVVIPA
jgi:spoIIIJ-associated protein